MAQGRPGGPGGPGRPGQMQPGSGKALRRALGYLHAYRRDAAGALAALILVSGANLVAP